MQKTSIRIVVYLSLLGIILGVTAIAFHHHDNAFLPPTCTLCKVKTSFSGTLNKIKADILPAAMGLCLSLAAILLSLSGILPDRKTVFIDSQIVKTYPNKAPPLTLC